VPAICTSLSSGSGAFATAATRHRTAAEKNRSRRAGMKPNGAQIQNYYGLRIIDNWQLRQVAKVQALKSTLYALRHRNFYLMHPTSAQYFAECTPSVFGKRNCHLAPEATSMG